jgi:hypothetical protein
MIEEETITEPEEVEADDAEEEYLTDDETRDLIDKAFPPDPWAQHWKYVLGGAIFLMIVLNPLVPSPSLAIDSAHGLIRNLAVLILLIKILERFVRTHHWIWGAFIFAAFNYLLFVLYLRYLSEPPQMFSTGLSLKSLVIQWWGILARVLMMSAGPCALYMRFYFFGESPPSSNIKSILAMAVVFGAWLIVEIIGFVWHPSGASPTGMISSTDQALLYLLTGVALLIQASPLLALIIKSTSSREPADLAQTAFFTMIIFHEIVNMVMLVTGYSYSSNQEQAQFYNETLLPTLNWIRSISYLGFAIAFFAMNDNRSMLRRFGLT